MQRRYQRHGFWLIGVWLLFICEAHTQTFKFDFDAGGNLVAQTDAVSAVPVILSQPQPRIVQPGEFASFFVVAADLRDLTYQWQFNGTNLVNATNDTLLVTNVTAAKEGPYSVVLVNTSGSVTSAPAALWIDSDGDSLVDSWETTYFANLNQYPGGDFDNDGVLNRDEFRDGTNPTNNASALYRVFINSDGGSITFSPNKPNYTNGEVVTVTAVPSAQEKFHGWTGDVVSTNNSIVLTMTTNRSLTAHFSYYTIYWTNTAGGDWHTARNWSPNLVPAMGDTAVLNIGVAVAANSSAECGALNLGGPGINPSIGGSDTLTVHSNGVWTSGNMTGASRTIIGSNATFTINNNASTVFLDSRTLENAGTILWTGADSFNLQCGNNAVITTPRGRVV